MYHFACGIAFLYLVGVGDMKKFDLNVEKVLENWETHHALRELIANAIDEQVLTKTEDIRIFKDDQSFWHIKDFGRGLKCEHLTQNENEEKLKHPHLVIGKFGVGLKDALATFDRKNIGVLIKSKYGDIAIEKASKHGFESIVTLHAVIQDSSEPNFIGTEIFLKNVDDHDIQIAKDFFLQFSNEQTLEKTQYGDVLKGKMGEDRRIYINGVKAAEEENFLFSYNITSLTQAMRKALNRERSYVGRTAYTARIKTILLACQKTEVATLMVDDLQQYNSGQIHEELKWVDIASHASRILNSNKKVLFMTSNQLITAKDTVDLAERDGYKIITVPENVQHKISGSVDMSGKKITDVNQFNLERNRSFKFNFVDPDCLTNEEKMVYSQTSKILDLVGGQPHQVKEIRISETMRPDSEHELGLWQADKQRIIIRRSQLNSLSAYAGTLLHEVSHAVSGASDVSRQFESKLTEFLGLVSVQAIQVVHANHKNQETAPFNQFGFFNTLSPVSNKTTQAEEKTLSTLPSHPVSSDVTNSYVSSNKITLEKKRAASSFSISDEKRKKPHSETSSSETSWKPWNP